MTHKIDDDRGIDEVPPDEPLGSVPVNFNVPIPTAEQISGEIARQILRGNHTTQAELRKHAERELNSLISAMILEKATPIIEDLLTKPMQPTDCFGNPIGEPTTLHGVLARRVSDWANDVVDSDGNPQKRDGYNSRSISPRINWALGKIVNNDLKKLVDTEVTRIVATLKESATANIAKQIAEKISGLVLK